MKPQPKIKPLRSKKYRLFVASHKCCCCPSVSGIIAHHPYTGGMGTKCSDDLCVPLCFYCHEKMDNKRKDDIPGLEGVIRRLQKEYAEQEATCQNITQEIQPPF